MSESTKIKQHYLIDVTSDIKDICAPLVKHFGIKHFCYSRNYPNGTSVALTMDADVIENMHEVFIAGLDKKGSYVKDGFYLQHEMTEEYHSLQSFFAHFTQRFGADHHLLFYEHYQTYMEQFVFGVDPRNLAAYSFYTENLDLFERFMIYFKDKAKKIIDEADKHRIIIPKVAPRLELPINHYEKIRKDFLQDIQHSHYFVDNKDGGTFISQRELDVVYCLSRGRTAKEIGSELSLSPRTVESYLNSVKNKLGCFNKSQVIDIFLASKLNKKDSLFKD